MHIQIIYGHNGKTIDLRGTVNQISRELIFHFPTLAEHHHKDLLANLKILAKQQNIFLRVIDDKAASIKKSEDHFAPERIVNAFGWDQDFRVALEAARYLGNGKRPTEEEIRSALMECNEDYEKAALLSCGVNPTEENVQLLQDVVKNVLCKSEGITVPRPKIIKAHCQLDVEFSEALTRAFDKEMVMPVKLGGKHAKGMFVAWDEQTSKTLLIKPGSGKQNPSAGMSEDDAPQSAREAAFYHLAEILGIQHHLPEARLVNLDGQPTAVLALLPWHYKKAQELSKKDPVGVRRLFNVYEFDGTLWKWATLDYIGGNVDRHGGNIMLYDSDVQLIDHGSSMAGPSFNPGGDKYTFIPYYLRVFSGLNFKVATPKERINAIPVASNEVDEKLSQWLLSVQPELVAKALYKYEVNPQPVLDRLKKLDELSQTVKISLAINKLWCTPK